MARDALPSRPGKDKSRDSTWTVHDTGAEFLCDLEQDLSSVWIFVFHSPGKKLLIFPLQGCFQASWIKTLQGLVTWHRSSCSSGVWHWCHSKGMARAEEKAGFYHALNSSSALHSPSKGGVAVNRHLLSSGFLYFEFMPIPTVIIQGIR